MDGMGSSSIYMSPEEMETVAAAFVSDNEEFNAVINSMHTRVTSLCESWKGMSSQKFATQFEELKPGFESTSRLMMEIASQLRSISVAMLDADSQIADQIGVQ